MSSLFTSINVPSDCLYQLAVTDNLLFINNMTEQMTFLYDIKKNKPNEQLVFPAKISLVAPSSPCRPIPVT